MRAPLPEWRSRKIKWDATEGHNGRAEGTAWEALLEMEKYDVNANEFTQGAVTVVVDFAQAFERVRLDIDRKRCTSVFRNEVFGILCGYVEHQRRVQVEERVADPLH